MKIDKKVYLFLFASMITFAFVLYSCNLKNSIKPRSNDENDLIKVKTVEPSQPGEINEKDDTKTGTGKPMSSGITTIVPWENDDKFKITQGKNDTFILMAAYCTVLRDPLPGEEYNVHLAARLLAGTVVNPGQVFSQNRTIGPYTQDRGFQKGPTYIGSQLTTTVGGGVCKIASTLYNVAILSNLQVVERHAHSMPVPYVPYGQDATVAYGARDFKFKNDTPYPILIWAQGVDNILYIAFYGKIKPPKVQWHHEVLQTIKAPTIFKRNPMLPEGAEKVLLEGMDGAVIKSWLTIKTPDGTTILKKLGNSYYSPMPYIIEKN